MPNTAKIGVIVTQAAKEPEEAKARAEDRDKALADANDPPRTEGQYLDNNYPQLISGLRKRSITLN